MYKQLMQAGWAYKDIDEMPYHKFLQQMDYMDKEEKKKNTLANIFNYRAPSKKKEGTD